MKTTFFRWTLFLLMVIFWQAAPATGALVGYEPFNYASGDALHNKNGGTFADEWADNKYWVPGFEASNGGLTYPGLATSGNAALNEGTGSDYRLNRPIGREWNTNVNEEFWLSFLLRVDDASSQTDEFIGLVLSKPGVVGSVRIGMYDTRNFGFSIQRHDNIYVTHNEGTNDDPLTVGQTHLILAHLTFNAAAPDILDLWVDPTIGSPLGAPNDSYSNSRMVISQVDIRTGYLEGGSLVDEIRIGTASNDVLAPIPLPGAFWLLGAGILGLMGIQRRSRSQKSGERFKTKDSG